VGRLIETWAAWGLKLRPGVSEHDLDAFEATHQVRLPPDFRDYLGRCNGFDYQGGGSLPDDLRGLLEFVPLRSMEKIAAKASVVTRRRGSASAYLFFADYLISSHVYGIRLAADPSAATPVVAWFGPGDVCQIAASFAGFVDVYLDAPDRLWGRR
jgi:hypothetical protein